jgi:hypothetical protein
VDKERVHLTGHYVSQNIVNVRIYTETDKTREQRNRRTRETTSRRKKYDKVKKGRKSKLKGREKQRAGERSITK